MIDRPRVKQAPSRYLRHHGRLIVGGVLLLLSLTLMNSLSQSLIAACVIVAGVALIATSLGRGDAPAGTRAE